MVTMITEMIGWPTMRLRKTLSTANPNKAVARMASKAASQKGSLAQAARA